MKTRVKKLFNNKISIRGYIIKKLIDNKEDLIVNYGKETMTIKHKDLTKGITDNNIYKSKYDGREYKLVDYTWITDSATNLYNQDKML